MDRQTWKHGCAHILREDDSAATRISQAHELRYEGLTNQACTTFDVSASSPHVDLPLVLGASIASQISKAWDPERSHGWKCKRSRGSAIASIALALLAHASIVRRSPQVTHDHLDQRCVGLMACGLRHAYLFIQAGVLGWTILLISCRNVRILCFTMCILCISQPQNAEAMKERQVTRKLAHSFGREYRAAESCTSQQSCLLLSQVRLFIF